MPVYLYDGKILTVAGAIAVSEDCCCGTTCPGSCTDWPYPTITTTITNGTGDCVNCDEASSALSQVGMACSWFYGFLHNGPPYCTGTVTVSCVNKSWVLEARFSNSLGKTSIYRTSRPNTTGRPPTGSYALPYVSGPCDMLTVQIDIT
jgi:hypothetical protein